MKRSQNRKKMAATMAGARACFGLAKANAHARRRNEGTRTMAVAPEAVKIEK